MMDEYKSNSICPKCNVEMEAGYLLEYKSIDRFPTFWIEGHLERSFFASAKIRGKKIRIVESFRCTNCGFLELYAREEWKGFPKLGTNPKSQD